jgi:predicted CopG family antitoxin
MAVKTITIDMDAYTLLAAHKAAGESFSQVIKRTFAEERYTASHLLSHLDEVALSEEALDATETVARDRIRDMVTEPEQSYDA